MDKWTKITDSSNWILPYDRKLIAMCDKAGYIGIGVCMSDESIKSSVRYSFGPNNSLFTEPGPTYKRDTWPLIWKIAEDLGIAGGSGNAEQKQLMPDHKLTKACYKKVKNEWYYRLHPDTVKEVGSKFGV